MRMFWPLRSILRRLRCNVRQWWQALFYRIECNFCKFQIGSLRLNNLLGTAIVIGALMIGLEGCASNTQTVRLVDLPEPPTLLTENETRRLSGSISEVAPPAVLLDLAELTDRYEPRVTITSPKADQVIQSDQIDVKLKVKGLSIYKEEDLELGPHIQLILDNQPAKSVYSLDEAIAFEDLTPGTHTLRAIATQPWGESFKNAEAYAQTTFHVFAKTGENSPAEDQPLITYLEPQGHYSAEPVLLDFYLNNAPIHSIAQQNSADNITDWQIRCSVNGQSFVFDQWQPIYLKGFKTGQNWVQLSLIDDQGRPIKNAFNNTVHTFDYDPQKKGPLAKIVRGELPIEQIGQIAFPSYTPPEIVSEPSITEKTDLKKTDLETPEVPQEPSLLETQPLDKQLPNKASESSGEGDLQEDKSQEDKLQIDKLQIDNEVLSLEKEEEREKQRQIENVQTDLEKPTAEPQAVDDYSSKVEDNSGIVIPDELERPSSEQPIPESPQLSDENLEKEALELETENKVDEEQIQEEITEPLGSDSTSDSITDSLSTDKGNTEDNGFGADEFGSDEFKSNEFKANALESKESSSAKADEGGNALSVDKNTDIDEVEDENSAEQAPRKSLFSRFNQFFKPAKTDLSQTTNRSAIEEDIEPSQTEDVSSDESDDSAEQPIGEEGLNNDQGSLEVLDNNIKSEGSEDEVLGDENLTNEELDGTDAESLEENDLSGDRLEGERLEVEETEESTIEDEPLNTPSPTQDFFSRLKDNVSSIIPQPTSQSSLETQPADTFSTEDEQPSETSETEQSSGSSSINTALPNELVSDEPVSETARKEADTESNEYPTESERGNFDPLNTVPSTTLPETLSAPDERPSETITSIEPQEESQEAPQEANLIEPVD